MRLEGQARPGAARPRADQAAPFLECGNSFAAFSRAPLICLYLEGQDLGDSRDSRDWRDRRVADSSGLSGLSSRSSPLSALDHAEGAEADFGVDEVLLGGQSRFRNTNTVRLGR